MSKKNQNLLDIVPIYSPRTNFNQIKAYEEKMISDMTLNFDKTSIGLIRQEFKKKNGELTLDEFTIFTKKHLRFWQPDLPNRDQSLQRYLTQLFNEIDINGNCVMQQKEFINYIIQKAVTLKNLKGKYDQIKRYVKSDAQPKIKIAGVIQKAQYIKSIQKVAFFQEGSSRIYFMDINNGSVLPKSLQIDPKKLIISVSSIKKKKIGKMEVRKKDFQIPTEVRVLDILFLNEKKYKILVVATSDGFIRGFTHTQNGFVLATQPDNEEQLFEHYFNSQIYCLAWDNINEVLYCGQKNGSIYVWNLKTDLEKSLDQSKANFDQKQTFEKRINFMITCMITMPKLQFMASGRMDGKLILWDTINNKKKWVYKEHTRGILSLAFNQNMILLFSAGFDHKICVWNPYIQTLIHKLQVHLAPILTLRVIESSNQLISFDSDGTVKITDTKRFNGIYSFIIQKQQNKESVTPDSNGYNLSGFISIDMPSKLIFLGKSLSIYDYDKNYNPSTADQHVVVALQYIEQTMSFITASGNKIKVWSALSGDIDKIFTNISQNQITSMALNSRKKCVIIGDIEGNVSIHNVLNGARLKKLAKHSTQVHSMLSIKNQISMLITCSVDNEIRIFKQVEDNFEILRFIHFRSDLKITCLDYQKNLKSLMVGTNLGTVEFYDPYTGKNTYNCLNKNDGQITSISQTQQSIIISTTSTGKIFVFGLPPLHSKFQKIITFIHRDCEKQQENVPLGINSSCYNQDKNILYIVDDKMYLTCYDFSSILFYKQKGKLVNNQKVLDTNKNLRQNKFKILWQIKASHQFIKLVKYIPNQNLICTCSFDKKVLFWNSDTGKCIESLQQNYNKAIPEPIAFYDLKNYLLISKTKTNTIDRVKINLQALQADPFQFQTFIQKYHLLKNQKSNKEWNLNVKISANQSTVNLKIQTQKGQKKLNVFTIENQEKKQNIFRVSFSQPFALIKQQQYLHKVKKDLSNFHKMLNKQRTNSNFLEITNRFSSSRQSMSHSVKSTANFFNQTGKTFYQKNKLPQKPQQLKKRFQNCTDKKQQEEGSLINSKQKQLVKKNIFSRRRDYIPIRQLIGPQKKNIRSNEHQHFIQRLYKDETQSILNSRQEESIYLGAQQAKATKKLCELLLQIDDTDKRPKNLLQNVKVKQTSQSTHIELRKGLPKI